MLKRRGVLLKGGRDLEYDAILAELSEHGGDLALAERVVERVVDELRRQPEPADNVAVEPEHQARRGGLEIAGHVLQFWQRFELLQYDGRPFEQLGYVGILQGILVLRLSHPRAD